MYGIEVPYSLSLPTYACGEVLNIVVFMAPPLMAIGGVPTPRGTTPLRGPFILVGGVREVHV